jgi:hypothetical protein
MFLRWARSNIRETLVLLSFLFKPFRTDYLWGFRINSVLIASTLVIPYFLMVHSYYLLLTNPFWLFRYAVMIVMMSIPMAAIYSRSERDSDFAWVVAYELFWILACQWIMPYAFLTCRRQGAWITRGEAKKVTLAQRPVYVPNLQELPSASPVLTSSLFSPQGYEVPGLYRQKSGGNENWDGIYFDRKKPDSNPFGGRGEHLSPIDFPGDKRSSSL